MPTSQFKQQLVRANRRIDKKQKNADQRDLAELKKDEIHFFEYDNFRSTWWHLISFIRLESRFRLGEFAMMARRESDLAEGRAKIAGFTKTQIPMGTPTCLCCGDLHPDLKAMVSSDLELEKNSMMFLGQIFMGWSCPNFVIFSLFYQFFTKILVLRSHLLKEISLGQRRALKTKTLDFTCDDFHDRKRKGRTMLFDEKKLCGGVLLKKKLAS